MPQRLNTWNKGKPTERDIRIVLENCYSEDGIADIMEQMVEVGGAMFSMGIQFLVAKELFKAPEAYSQLCVNTDAATLQFKKSPSVTSLVKYLNRTFIDHTAKTEQSASKGSWVKLLNETYQHGHNSSSNSTDDDENEEIEVRRPRLPKKKKKKTSRLDELLSRADSTDDSTDSEVIQQDEDTHSDEELQ